VKVGKVKNTFICGENLGPAGDSGVRSIFKVHLSLFRVLGLNPTLRSHYSECKIHQHIHVRVNDKGPAIHNPFLRIEGRSKLSPKTFLIGNDAVKSFGGSSMGPQEHSLIFCYIYNRLAILFCTLGTKLFRFYALTQEFETMNVSDLHLSYASLYNKLCFFALRSDWTIEVQDFFWFAECIFCRSYGAPSHRTQHVKCDSWCILSKLAKH
jgi:hypothetical protein